jgi:putative glycosyltransferase
VVTTTFNSAETLEPFLERVRNSVEAMNVREWELIVVDDGSVDNSVEVLRRNSGKFPMKAIILSKNWGHSSAIRIGLREARGELVFLIDSDLEESPEWLEEMSVVLRDEGLDAVFGVQKSRRGGLLEKLSGFIFYRTFRFFSGVAQPDNILTIRLMKKRFVEAFNEFTEVNLNLGATWSSIGFEVKELAFSKPRLWKTRYSIASRLRIFLWAIVNYSSKLLYLNGVLGAIGGLLSVFVSVYWVVNFLAFGALEGFTSLAVAIWLLGGLILWVSGIASLYLAQIQLQTKQRPLGIVREIIDSR